MSTNFQKKSIRVLRECPFLKRLSWKTQERITWIWLEIDIFWSILRILIVKSTRASNYRTFWRCGSQLSRKSVQFFLTEKKGFVSDVLLVKSLGIECNVAIQFSGLYCQYFGWCGSFSQIKQIKSLRLALNGGYVICFTNFRIKHNRKAELLTGLKGQDHRLSDRKGQVYSYLIKNILSSRVLTINQFRRRKKNQFSTFLRLD